jgi:hypothetical protein
MAVRFQETAAPLRDSGVPTPVRSVTATHANPVADVFASA